jgi:tetratricopeptide (TPR) repeat protein
LQGKGDVRHDAAYGSALASLRAKLTDDAEAVITAYPLSAAKDKEVRAEIYWQRARSAFDHGDFQGTLNALNARMALVAEPTDLSTLRGWAHFKLGHKQEAKAIFTKLNSQLADSDLMQGLAALDEKPR